MKRAMDQKAKTRQPVPNRKEFLESLEPAMNRLPVGVALLRHNGEPIFFNESFREMYDIDDDISNWKMSFDELVNSASLEKWKQDPVKFFERVQTAIGHGRDFKEQIEIGERIFAVHDVPMEGGLILSTQQDVTERVLAERRVAHLARHDPLTDLPNRAAFVEKLSVVMEEARVRQEKFAVLSLDLDRFKDVNDVFGHAAGDALLGMISKRFRECAGENFPARLGGDEFSFISIDPNQPTAGAALCDLLFDRASGEIEFENGALMVGLSIGMAIFPDDGDDVVTLLANADAALYRAKADGRGVMRSFSPEVDARIREQRILQQELRLAVQRGEFTLHYQPQSTVDGDITGMEALLRWQHPTRGLLMPGVFVSLAEDSGKIVDIGTWVLREACHEAASWTRPLRVSVNLSPVQFRHGDLAQTIHETLLQTGLPADRLEVEITEGVLVSDFTRALNLLRRIKALGVHIAMDDFGTGYSSLSYLQAFPFDTLKIDRSFISRLGEDAHTNEIVRAVIGLGRGLRLPIIAEGVETEEQLAFLAREHCQAVQGYLIGRPAPIADYAAIVGKSPSAAVQRSASSEKPRRRA